jgi:hypothetical protein
MFGPFSVVLLCKLTGRLFHYPIVAERHPEAAATLRAPALPYAATPCRHRLSALLHVRPLLLRVAP